MPVRKLVFILSAVLALCVSVWVYHMRIGGNFYAVIGGELYRSAQPTPEQIEKYVKKYGIKTILNLRGIRSNKKWFIEESKISNRLILSHRDFAVSSTMLTPLEDMDRIVAIMKQSPKPMLIHCWAGADRTGLATALYLYSIKDMEPEKAKSKALSVFYGHFPYLGSRSDAVGESFDNYVRSGHGRP